MRLLYLLLSLLTVFRSVAQDARATTVYFPFDQHALTAEARAELDRFLGQYKSGGISGQLTIRGFCDAVGTDDYNNRLSEKRVETVLRYLVEGGIPAASIVLRKGYGEREPLNTNSTPEERRQNRRVELGWTLASAAAPVPARPEPRDSVTVFSKTAIDTARQGQTLRLRNINFIGGRHIFLQQSMPVLNELLEVMKANPTLEIEIQGHICCRIGSSEDGLDFDTNAYNLSHTRARAVFDYLVEGGIDPKRMRYKGFAGTVPLVNPELTEEDRTTNRRVEIKILKK